MLTLVAGRFVCRLPVGVKRSSCGISCNDRVLTYFRDTVVVSDYSLFPGSLTALTKSFLTVSSGDWLGLNQEFVAVTISRAMVIPRIGMCVNTVPALYTTDGTDISGGKAFYRLAG